jgi:hypothetical protein
MKKGTLAAGLKAAASRKVTKAAKKVPAAKNNGNGSTVFIGGQFSPEVRQALKMAEAKSGKKLKPLLEEAFNYLCSKYKVPAPCAGE